MADDPELEVIRQKRLQELKAQNRGDGSMNDDAKKAEANEEMRSSILMRILDSGARQRLSRICLVKPEKSRFIEDNLIQQARKGELRGRINEEQLIEFLNFLSKQEQQIYSNKITITRKERNVDEDDADEEEIFTKYSPGSDSDFD